MTLPRFTALSAYWRNYPPVHISVAAYLGINKSDDEPKAQSDFSAKSHNFETPSEL